MSAPAPVNEQQHDHRSRYVIACMECGRWCPVLGNITRPRVALCQTCQRARLAALARRRQAAKKAAQLQATRKLFGRIKED